MTGPSEVKISDAECEAIERTLRIECDSEYWRAITRQALQSFLARRVPDAMWFEKMDDRFARGANACRARVLNGE